MTATLRPLVACISVAFGLIALPAQAVGVGFSGEFWDQSTTINDLSDALAVIASRPADATFTSTVIDYPNGPDNTVDDSFSLQTFLGADAASLFPVINPAISDSVWRISGSLDLAAGLHDFVVGSDDGFQLSLNGSVVSSFADQRQFDVTSVILDLPGGAIPFELVVFEHFSVTGFNFAIDGVTVDTSLQSVGAPVPVPASLPLILAALGGFVYLRRRGNA